MEVVNKLRKVYRQLKEEINSHENILSTKNNGDVNYVNCLREKIIEAENQMDFIEKAFRINNMEL